LQSPNDVDARDERGHDGEIYGSIRPRSALVEVVRVGRDLVQTLEMISAPAIADVVFISFQGSSSLKVRNGGKYVLKEAARKLVPDAVIDRPKGYFPVPALKYLRGPFLALVRDILNEPAARRRELFRRDYVNDLLANPETTLTPKRHSKLWQVALLEFWLQTHGL
jgi:asparagine synthetase B (glutamine-hydrolysing)